MNGKAPRIKVSLKLIFLTQSELIEPVMPGSTASYLLKDAPLAE